MPQKLLATMQTRYDALQPREQRALLLLILFVSAVLLWLFVWKPVQEMRTESAELLGSARESYAWMQAHEAQARAGAEVTATATAKTGTSLLAAVNDAAGIHRLTLTRAEPSGDDAIRITIDDGGFNRLLAWLEALKRENGLNVAQITIERREEPGHVSVSMLLRTR